jgi:death on curing protein
MGKLLDCSVTNNMNKKTKIICPNLDEIQYVAHELACKLMGYNEPIPDFITRYPNTLERCLGALQQTYNQKDLYPTFLDKASILFYLMIKNHPFQNGNKRVAMMSLFYFLIKNKKWIRVDTKVLYNFAKWVAESNSDVKDAVLDAIKIFLKGNMIKINHEIS